MISRALFFAIVLALAACASPRLSPYRIEIQQGNYVTQEMVDQLKPGMTRDQVRFILGTPLVSDIFHADRWDYVFMRQRAGSREVEQRRIAVFFEDDKLSRVMNEPAATPSGAATPKKVQR